MNKEIVFLIGLLSGNIDLEFFGMEKGYGVEEILKGWVVEEELKIGVEFLVEVIKRIELE